MVDETRYGVISDIHNDPRIIVPTLKVLEEQGAQKLLVNGDIGERMDSLEDSQRYTGFIINAIGKSGLDAYVQPGSHETVGAFHPVLQHFAKEFPNVKSVFEGRRVEQADHDLVFIPGSDFLAGGEYQITSDEDIKTGLYKQKDNNFMFYENMNDLRKQVRDPRNTIVVCHVPRKFDNLETAVDMAEFGEATSEFPYQGRMVSKGAVFPMHFAEELVSAGHPVVLKKENRGNEGLRSLYDELGITKAVSGHFHESSHRATDSQGNHVPEGALVDDLFWNSGHLDVGYTGILTVQGEKVSYRNIDLKEHVK